MRINALPKGTILAHRLGFDPTDLLVIQDHCSVILFSRQWYSSLFCICGSQKSENMNRIICVWATSASWINYFVSLILEVEYWDAFCDFLKAWMKCGFESWATICWLFFYLDGFMHSIVEISCLFFLSMIEICFLSVFWQRLQRTNYRIIIQWEVGLTIMLSNTMRFKYDISVYNVREIIRFDSVFSSD